MALLFPKRSLGLMAPLRCLGNNSCCSRSIHLTLRFLGSMTPLICLGGNSLFMRCEGQLPPNVRLTLVLSRLLLERSCLLLERSYPLLRPCNFFEKKLYSLGQQRRWRGVPIESALRGRESVAWTQKGAVQGGRQMSRRQATVPHLMRTRGEGVPAHLIRAWGG